MLINEIYCLPTHVGKWALMRDRCQYLAGFCEASLIWTSSEVEYSQCLDFQLVFLCSLCSVLDRWTFRFFLFANGSLMIGLNIIQACHFWEVSLTHYRFGSKLFSASIQLMWPVLSNTLSCAQIFSVNLIFLETKDNW